MLKIPISSYPFPVKLKTSLEKKILFYTITCKIYFISYKIWIFFTFGPGIKCPKEVGTVIREASSSSFHSPCAERLLGNKISKPHTVPCKWPSCCGSVLVSHPCPQRHWLCLCFCAQETTDDGWLWWLLPTSQGLHCHPGQLCQGFLWCRLQDLQLSDPQNLQRACVHQVSSEMHWPSCDVLWSQAPAVATT